MKKMKELDNILEECLQRLGRGETIEQCLASYPGQAAELGPLLQTALLARKTSAIRPSADFKNRARYQFRMAVREMMQEKRWSLFSLHPRWATVAIVILVLLLASGSTVAAASNVMPDNPLYPVKLATETVRVTLTPSPLDKAQLYADLADRRVAELIRMADEGKVEQVEKATERLDAQLQKASRLVATKKPAAALIAPAPQAAPPAVAPAPERTPTPAPTPTNEPTPKPTVKTPTRTPAPTVTPTPSRSPTPVQPSPSAPGPALSGTAPASGQADSAKTKTTADVRVKTDKRAVVKATVAAAAIKHDEALKAELKKAPEPAKAALKRAIAVTDNSYKRLLEALDRDD